MAEAAERSSVVKASRWGQIENGYLMKGGEPVPTRAGAMQLAHMARVVGVSPERLSEAGRSDAAEILGEIQHQEAEQNSGYPDPADHRERAIWDMQTVSEADRREIIDLLRIGKAQRRKSG